MTQFRPERQFPYTETEKGAIQREGVKRASAAMESLSNDQREVVRLKLEGLTFKQIGERIGLPISTVQRLFNSAKEIIKAAVK